MGLSKQERNGAVALGIVTLILISLGFVSKCRESKPIDSPEVVVIHRDTIVKADKKKSPEKKKKKPKTMKNKKSSKTKGSAPVPRSARQESVPLKSPAEDVD